MPKIVLDLHDRYVLDDGSVVLRRKALLSCIRNGYEISGLTAENSKDAQRHNKLSKPEKRLVIVTANDEPGVVPAWRYEWPTPEPWKSENLVAYCVAQLTKLGLTEDKYYVRLAEEIAEIEQRDMEGFFRHVWYVTSDMDRRQIVRGVGRGSSCASLVLFLLGIHHVDPVFYDIPMIEFFKPITIVDEDDAVPSEETGPGARLGCITEEPTPGST